MSINKPSGRSAENKLLDNRAALALVLLLSSCSPSAQQQPPTTPEPIVDAEKEAEEFLDGNKEIQVSIPDGDDIKKSLVDFMQFCKSQGIKCEFNGHDKDGDLMEISNAFPVCKPEGAYNITIKNENGILRIEKMFESDGSATDPGNEVTLNEILRGIIQNPWMLEAVKRNNLEANGSIAMATIPEDQIPKDQIKGERIAGHPRFIIEKMRYKHNCETGAIEADFSGYPRKIGDNGSSVFIEYNEDGSYRISYGGQLGPVTLIQQ